MTHIKNHVVCLYDENGLSGRDWAEAGYEVFCYDLAHAAERSEAVGLGTMHFVPWDAHDTVANAAIIERHRGRVKLVMGFPPCDDMATCGAVWFAAKALKDPDFQTKAVWRAKLVKEFGDAWGAPYFAENPVSVLSTLWRKADYYFHPWHYGGYLPEDDQYPIYPEYIRARDAYPKLTCYWTGNGFVMPEKKPVHCESGYSVQYKKLGGKSKKTKKIRSMTPRGIMRAIYEANQ